MFFKISNDWTIYDCESHTALGILLAHWPDSCGCAGLFNSLTVLSKSARCHFQLREKKHAIQLYEGAI